MPSAKKNRRKKAFVNTNKKKLWKNLKKKRFKRIESDQVRNSWNSKRSILQNLEDMGLASDPNKVLAPPSKPFAAHYVKDENKVIKNPGAIKAMEAIVERGEKVKSPHLPPSGDIFFCEHMLSKHGDDYKAMARDRKNIFQLTPKQIREKLRKYTKSKENYENYKKEKQKRVEHAKINKNKAMTSSDDEAMTSAMDTADT